LPRLSAVDLTVLARYVFGVRGWQTALAKELGVSRTMVVLWVGGRRPVSEKMSRRIAMIARVRHDRRVIADRENYLAMCQGLSSTAARTLLLSMITGEVEARVALIAQLTGQIEQAIHRLSRIAREGAGDGIEQLEAPRKGDGLLGTAHALPALPLPFA
jgi:hypothetical protein